METQKQITEILFELVKIPSVTSNRGECKRVIDFAAQLFEASSFEIQRFEHNDVHSLVISKNKKLQFPLVFLGHLDVVPAGREQFQPRIKEGWMFGRGSSDMKGSCAAMIQLFLDHEDDPAFNNFALVLTGDEETGGEDGIAYLVNEIGLRADTVFNPDGGDIYKPCLGQKGILRFRVSVKGSSCHAARPWFGKNAALLLMKDIEHVLSSFDYATKEDPWKISCSLSQIEAGETINSVPEHAHAYFDVRYTSEHTSAEIIETIQGNLQHGKIEVLLEGDPVSIEEDNPVLQKLFEATEAHGYPRETSRNLTGSDARWFSKQGSNILLMLPNGTEGHIDDEGVDLASLAQLYSVMKYFAKNYDQ